MVRGSYNTTFELAQSNVPFIVCPRGGSGIHSEQLMRAQLLEQAGFAAYLPEEIITAKDVATSLDKLHLQPPTQERANLSSMVPPTLQDV